MAAGVIEVRSRLLPHAQEYTYHTSQALELGADTLLFDEDTCATNFLIRDCRMQRLIAADPITPLVYKACTSPNFYTSQQWAHTDTVPRSARCSQTTTAHPSSLLADVVRIGLSLALNSAELGIVPGDYCDVANLVLEMRDYRCYDITAAAKQIAQEIPSAVPEHEG